MKKKGPLAGKRIIVGVTGSIAAYKSAEIVSQLVQRSADVTVVMTPAAKNFIGPLTFQTITRNRVMIDPFDLDSVIDASHISLTEEADLVLVAPATANFLAKVAHGMADDMLSSLILAVTCPVLIAPAMNDRMWKNAAVQENLVQVRKLGYRLVDPEAGFLACGTYAIGRLAEPAGIVAAVESTIAS